VNEWPQCVQVTLRPRLVSSTTFDSNGAAVVVGASTFLHFHDLVSFVGSASDIVAGSILMFRAANSSRLLIQVLLVLAICCRTFSSCLLSITFCARYDCNDKSDSIISLGRIGLFWSLIDLS
jgi:hypothetical protein